MKLVKYILIGASAVTVVGVSSFCVVQATKNTKTTEVAKVDNYIEEKQVDNGKEINDLKNELANTKTMLEELQKQVNYNKSKENETKNEQTVVKDEEKTNAKVPDTTQKTNTVTVEKTVEKVVEKLDTEQIENLKKQLSKTETNLNDLSKESKEKQEELKKMADKRATLQEELTSLQKEAGELSEKHRELYNKKSKLQNEYYDNDSKIALYRIKIHGGSLSSEEEEDLKLKKQELETRQKEISNELANSELDKKIKEASDEYTKKVVEISAKQKEIDKLIIDMAEFD